MVSAKEGEIAGVEAVDFPGSSLHVCQRTWPLLFEVPRNRDGLQASRFDR